MKVSVTTSTAGSLCPITCTLYSRYARNGRSKRSCKTGKAPRREQSMLVAEKMELFGKKTTSTASFEMKHIFWRCVTYIRENPTHVGRGEYVLWESEEVRRA